MAHDSTQEEDKFDDFTWIGDSGCSIHLVKSDQHLYNVHHISNKINIGNGESMMATKKGSLDVLVQQKDGSTL